MGWKSGLAGLALAAGLAGVADAAEPGASYATFEGRDYLLLWPAAPPSTILVYLHMADAQPLGYEAQSGMLEALAADSALRGYAVLAPTASRNLCDLAEGESERFCWRIDAIGEELGHIDQLIAYLERNNDAAFTTRAAIGYGRGGDFLSAALAEGRLEGYAKIGLVDAGPPPPELSLQGAAATGPLVYLEAAEGDRVSAARAGELLAALVGAGYGAKTCAKGDLGGAFYDTRRLASFLAWFAQDCRASTPSPTSAPAPTVAPPPSETNLAPEIEPIVNRGVDADDAAVIEEANRQPPAVRPGPR
jgi:hypothetical protein